MNTVITRKTKNCLTSMYNTFNLEFLIQQDHEAAGNIKPVGQFQGHLYIYKITYIEFQAGLGILSLIILRLQTRLCNCTVIRCYTSVSVQSPACISQFVYLYSQQPALYTWFCADIGAVVTEFAFCLTAICVVSSCLATSKLEQLLHIIIDSILSKEVLTLSN